MAVLYHIGLITSHLPEFSLRIIIITHTQKNSASEIFLASVRYSEAENIILPRYTNIFHLVRICDKIISIIEAESPDNLAGFPY